MATTETYLTHGLRGDDSMRARNENSRSPRAFQDATRLQKSFTASVERRMLLWLAARLPDWVQPDHLTLLGFAATFLAGAGYALARWTPAGLLIATVCLALNWFGDSMDGTLARFRCRQRPRYGFYVDHMIDSIGAAFLMSGLALSGFVSPRIAFGMLVAFLLLSIEVYLAAYALASFQLAFAKIGPTEIRLLLMLGNTVLWLHPSATAFGLPYKLLDVGGAIAIAAMAAVLIASAIRHTVDLYREEAVRS